MIENDELIGRRRAVGQHGIHSTAAHRAVPGDDRVITHGSPPASLGLRLTESFGEQLERGADEDHEEQDPEGGHDERRDRPSARRDRRDVAVPGRRHRHRRVVDGVEQREGRAIGIDVAVAADEGERGDQQHDADGDAQPPEQCSSWVWRSGGGTEGAVHPACDADSMRWTPLPWTLVRASRSIVMLWLVGGFLAAGYGVLFTLLDDIRDEYGIGESALGAVIGIGFVAGFVAQVTIAPLADRGHARALVIVGMLLNVVGLLVMAASTSVVPLLAGRLVTGVAAGMAVPAIRRIVISADPVNLGHNLGRLLAADVAGFAAGPALSAVLVGPFGIPAPFIVIAGGQCDPAALRGPHVGARVGRSARSSASPSTCCASGPTPEPSPSGAQCG